jgi:nucleotide-binding universal stress UspA family protein
VGITRAAAEHGADLIVMATHGRTGLHRAIVGSVAGTVLRTGSTPVLLVHPHFSAASSAAEQLEPAMHA